jgi:uncharacterized protein
LRNLRTKNLGPRIARIDTKRLFWIFLSKELYLKKILTVYLDNFIITIKELCQQNNVKSLYVFGSVISDRFNEGSDIDLIVEINSDDPVDYAEHYFNLKFGLQDLLERPVDLLESKAISNLFIRQNIDDSKHLIYAA